MSSVYHQLRSEFAVDESFMGSEIQEVILDTIKVEVTSLIRIKL